MHVALSINACSYTYKSQFYYFSAIYVSNSVCTIATPAIPWANVLMLNWWPVQHNTLNQQNSSVHKLIDWKLGGAEGYVRN